MTTPSLPVIEMARELAEALQTVQGVRAYTDLGATIEGPATVLDAPSFTWDGFGSTPTSARWLVYLVVPQDERAMPRLWGLIPIVAAAIDSVRDAAVVRADPGVFLSGTQELPCYEITVEVSL